jgi:two-component system, NarL family, response regulator DevR
MVLEDKPELRRSLARTISGPLVPVPCESIAEAEAALELDLPLAGAILDVQLPDGSGLDILRQIRLRWPLMPVLVMTGSRSATPALNAHMLDAIYLPKPVPPQNIRYFLQLVEAVAMTDDNAIGRALARYAETNELPRQQVQLLACSLRGVQRKDLAATLGVSENTVKSQVRVLLAKTGEPNLDAVERKILAMIVG